MRVTTCAGHCRDKIFVKEKGALGESGKRSNLYQSDPQSEVNRRERREKFQAGDPIDKVRGGSSVRTAVVVANFRWSTFQGFGARNVGISS